MDPVSATHTRDVLGDDPVGACARAAGRVLEAVDRLARSWVGG